MPGVYCAVKDCKSSAHKKKKNKEEIMFFRFPKDRTLQHEWVRRCGRPIVNINTFKRVCNKHFTKNDFSDHLKAELLKTKPKQLKKNAVPSLLLPCSVGEPTVEPLQDITSQFSSNIPEDRHSPKSNQEISCVDELKTEVPQDSSNKSASSFLAPPDYGTLLKQYENMVKENTTLKKQLSKLQSRNFVQCTIGTQTETMYEQDLPEQRKNFRVILGTFLSPNQIEVV